MNFKSPYVVCQENEGKNVSPGTKKELNTFFKHEQIPWILYFTFFTPVPQPGLKGEISMDADPGPLRYVLWCCGSRSQEEFTILH